MINVYFFLLLLLINTFSEQKAEEINNTNISDAVEVDLLHLPIYAPAPFKRDFNTRRGNLKLTKPTKKRTILRKSRFQLTTSAPVFQSNTPILQTVLPAEAANNFKNIAAASTTQANVNFLVLPSTVASVKKNIKNNRTYTSSKKNFHPNIVNEKKKTYSTEQKIKQMSSLNTIEGEKNKPLLNKQQEIYTAPLKAIKASHSPTIEEKKPSLLPASSVNLISHSSIKKKVVNPVDTIVRQSTPIKILTVLDSDGNIQIRSGKVIIRRLIH